jgi:polysaccharide export outer membrane protein
LLLLPAGQKKNIIYLQDSEQFKNVEQVANYEAIIQPDDIIQISVTSQNPEASLPFNQQSSGSSPQAAGYLVNKDGYISFPILGDLKVAGYTRTNFVEMLKGKLAPYISDAVVNLSIQNFKITVLGEVGGSGVIKVTGDRITLLEAIAQSGDLTVQGLRKNILIVRDNQGQKSFTRVDVTRADFVNSPFYYLKQNDVVYVEPRRAKYDATALGNYLPAIASIISLGLTITLILTYL